MPRGLPISTFVDITTSIAAGGVLRTEFGTGLLVTTDPTLAAGGSGKAAFFRDLNAVNDRFDAGDVIDDATVWFGADPPPKSLYVGRWADTDVSTSLVGGAPGAVSAIAVSNASWRLNSRDFGADLSAVTTYAGIASAVEAVISGRSVASVTVTAGGSGYTQASTTVAFAAPPGGGRTATGTVVVTSGAVTAINVTDGGTGYTSPPTVTITDSGGGSGATATAVLGAADPVLTGATFGYANNVFTLQLAGTNDIGYFAPDSTGAGTDISTLLGMTAAAGAESKQGHDAESVTDAVGEMIALATGGAPVALMLGSDAPLVVGAVDTREALAAYAQAGDFVYGLLDTADQALVTNDETSHVALAFERQQSRVEPVYSMPGERPDIGLLALMSSQNLNQPASIITPHLKPLPNVRPTRVTGAQFAELTRKRTNIYTSVGGLPALAGGYTGRAGSWLDAVWWLLWLKNEMELNIYNAQRASRRFNTGILDDTIGQVMRTAVQSGGVQAGGRVSAAIKADIIATTGNNDFDGILSAGHIRWLEAADVRSDLDRENRIGRFKVWIAPADAIHKVTGDIVLSA